MWKTRKIPKRIPKGNRKIKEKKIRKIGKINIFPQKAGKAPLLHPLFIQVSDVLGCPIDQAIPKMLAEYERCFESLCLYADDQTLKIK